VLDTALANCTTYTQAAMQYINQNAYSGTRLKVITNLYYPGYDADNALSTCTDPGTGQRVNKQSKFLPYLARMNWRACNFAAQYGFACADSFAQFMGADYDSNGDGQIDSDGLRYVQGESEDSYVNRLAVTLRSTIRDANVHLVNASTSYDYIQSDNTHPTYTGSTIYVGFFGGTGTGSGPPDYSGGQIAGGKNPPAARVQHEVDRQREPVDGECPYVRAEPEKVVLAEQPAIGDVLVRVEEHGRREEREAGKPTEEVVPTPACSARPRVRVDDDRVADRCARGLEPAGLGEGEEKRGRVIDLEPLAEPAARPHAHRKARSGEWHGPGCEARDRAVRDLEPEVAPANHQGVVVNAQRGHEGARHEPGGEAREEGEDDDRAHKHGRRD